MDFKNKIIEIYQKMLAEDKFLPEDRLKEGYEIFKDKFAPAKLKNLDGEILLETIFNHGNRDSLVYWLEFKNDDELQTNRYGGIGGGSALKFGIYKRKEDGKWITGSSKDMRELDLEEAIIVARERRDLLVKGAELISLIGDNYEDETYLKLQEKIDKELDNLGNLGWVHKYYHMIYPDKIDDFHSVEWQNFYLIKMHEKPLKPYGRYALAGQYMRLATQLNMPINYFTGVLMKLFGSPHNYWRIGTTDDSQSYWAQMLKDGYVSIGWPKLGDLNNLENMSNKEAKEYLKNQLSEKYPNTPQAIGRTANQILSFYKDIKKEDIVIAAEGQKILGIGRVIGDYEYKEGLSFPHCLNVRWFINVNEKLPNPSEGLMTTVNQYKNYDNLIAIEGLMNSAEPIKEFPQQPQRTLESLSGIIKRIEEILQRKNQVIIYGPPGTGKTYWAEKACLELAARKAFRKTYAETNDDEKAYLLGDGKSKGVVRFCCFHPSYGYEDFIEGIKPSISNGQTVFSLKDGIFKNICQEAVNNSDKNYYLIIDEINRGDISRIFGELITIIETGKRGKEMILPLSGDSFSVPENVFIVGTMNTADRSIALLDVALRRRFGFFELMPDYSLLSEITIENLPMGLWLSELNKRVVEHVGRDARNLQIGHSYFMEKDHPIKDFDKLRKVIQEDVIPLIEEYCYGDYHTISKIIGSRFVNTSTQEINHDLFKFTNKSELISALLEPKPEIATSSSVKQEENDEDDYEIDNEDIGGVQES
ncbi:ATPase AAA [Candidatus Syntrophocurvum alkaliphilum]|uniref:ATPase AAA n=1 Tax=Candidatus Syntrophocurvum alkaliphilum TaxID=2293317 RepID=A0A6I6DE77_9FIRM|nr:AAA family ATPase [Candidatus Syntrophocurvum alkaliphilum]QGT99477.1 ATPase AAA [Candidatus Syntrophocurvum alkaliphilum]